LEVTAKKIMVIDDDDANLQMIAAVMESRGYFVITASDGERGLELLEKENNIDLIITDVFMPKKEGIGFIRAAQSKNSCTKIIVMTGSVNYTTIAETARFFGADFTIQKPFEIEDFIEKVAQLLGERKL
jgi:two-component system chemotaxis response regulator CheY